MLLPQIVATAQNIATILLPPTHTILQCGDCGEELKK